MSTNGESASLVEPINEDDGSLQVSAPNETLLMRLKQFFNNMLSTIYNDIDNASHLIEDCVYDKEKDSLYGKFISDADQRFVSFQLLPIKTPFEDDESDNSTNINAESLLVNSNDLIAVDAKYTSCMMHLHPDQMINGLLSVIFIKKTSSLDEEKSLISQIQLISLDGSLVESIYSVISQSLNPLFRSYSKFVTTNQIAQNSSKNNVPTEYLINKLCPNYPSIEKKFTELEFGLLNLQEEIQFVTIRLIRHPTVVKLLKKFNCSPTSVDNTNDNVTTTEINNSQNVESTEEKKPPLNFIPQEEIDQLAADQPLLDSLQTYVTKWLNDIQKVIKIDTDPPVTGARQEISYWRQLNLSLNYVRNETKAKHVSTTIDILKSGKRLKSIFAWKNGSNTSELLKLVISYNSFLEVLSYDQLTDCHDIESLKNFVLSLFSNIRRIKNFSYPVGRLVKFIEAVTKDVTERILEIIIPQKLITLPKNEFDFIISQCFDIFMAWDDEYEKLHSVIREIFKQKREDFVKLFYKVNPYHRKLMERIESVRKFRRLHEELQSVIIRISSIHSLSNNFGNLFGEENTALEEIDNAWNIVVVTDYFDISKQGQDQWRASIARYDEKIDHIESKIASYLRDELGKANNSKEMFKIFSHFNALFIRPHIRGAIKEYQKQLLQHVNDDMTALMYKFKEQYINSNACRINRIKDIPPVAGSILWTRQIDQQLKLILMKVFDVLGSDLENHVDGKRLKLEIESFRNQLGLQKMLEQWVKLTNEKQICVDGKLFHLHNHRITDFDDTIIKIYRIGVNFTPDMITLAKEVRHMKAMGFRLPLSIINKAHQLSTVYPSAVSLIESLKTYDNAIAKLNQNKNLELLMCGYVNDMKNLILEGGTLIWESYKVEHYVRKFSEQATLIQEKIDDLVRILNKINDHIQLLSNCCYLSSIFESHLHQIQQFIDEITFQSYTNIDFFVESIESSVEQVLLTRLCTALKNWSVCLANFKSGQKTHGSISHFNPIQQGSNSADYRENASVLGIPKGFHPDFRTIKLEFHIFNQEIKLEPSIQQAKSHLVISLQQWIDVALSHKRFRRHAFKGNFVQDYSLLEQDATYRDLLSVFVQNNSTLLEIYDQIDQVCTCASDFARTWFNYQTLWDLPMESVLQRIICNDDWIQLLQSIRESRMTVDTIDHYRNFGCIQVDYRAIQSKVNIKYDAWQKDLFTKFSRVIQDDMSSFFANVQNAREILQNKNIEIASTYEAVSIVNDVQMYRRNVCSWKKEVENFALGEKILEKGRHKFGPNWIRAETISAEWESFIQILKNRELIIQKQFVTLQLKVTEQATLHDTHSNEVLQDWHSNKPVSGEFNCNQALNLIKSYEKTLLEIENEKKQIILAKEILDLTTTIAVGGVQSYFQGDDEISAAIDELKSLTNVWMEIKKFEEAIANIGEQLWLSVHPKKITNALEKLYDDFILLPSWIHQYDIYNVMCQRIRILLKVNKILYELKSESIKERHWKQLVRNLQLSDPWALPELTIQMIWDTDIETNMHIYRDVITSAQGETALEEFLRQVKEHWENVKFEMVDYKERFKIIKGWDELFSKLKEHLNSLVAMRHSPYFKMFEDETITWENKLTALLSLLDIWVVLQRRCIYLDGIFLGSGDIKILLPKEYKQFHSINVEFTNIMKRIDKFKLVIKALAVTGIQKNIEQLCDMLMNVQKSLGEYLEKERKSFPRFYFVGDEDLFEIIGNCKEIDCIQKHFKKMFAGIASIIFENSIESAMIVGVCSKENEIINLKTPVSLAKHPNIHDWLKQLDNNLKHTLALLLSECMASLETNITRINYPIDNFNDYYAFLNVYPEQIDILVLQILFCKYAESALSNRQSNNIVDFGDSEDRHVLEPLLDSIQGQLSFLANSVLSEKNYLIRHKLESAITELVHQRDVVRMLIQTNVTSVDHFLWVSQMRFYFDGASTTNSNDPTKCCVVVMADATFYYGFEYFGIIDRLVQTPLTDLCYLTMTQALKVKLGGSPFGPAGTGKTESVKALGCQLGRFVLVFNCDETFDFQAMGRIFTGLCQVGAWGCFDEFNRLEERMLSAVSQQIQTIQTALKDDSNFKKDKNKAAKVELLGREININHDMAIFITMNPGYAGRSNLPDNLKKLFRSLSMNAPDRELISQVMLYSQGFEHAEQISRKIIPFFKLCKEQLSQQSHYDFGLRALKTVLVSAGSIKRAYFDVNNEDLSVDSDDDLCLKENRIILQSIHDTILPKLVSEDGVLFHSLLNDVFAKIKPLRSPLESLKQIIFNVCKERHLIYENESTNNITSTTNEWFEKIMQLYSITCVNHGVMLVGPSGSGKSACWQVLLESLSRFESIESVHHIIDPKAVSKDELYGVLDSNTREWVDGLFTSCLRSIINNVHGEMQKRHWIVFDGDVDPEWVENLNSTLDDNKLLTLPNGERLSLPSNVRIIFEVTDLKYATLATVSRCGMVFFNEDVLSTHMILDNMWNNLGNYISNQEFDEINVVSPTAAMDKDESFSYSIDSLKEQVFNCLKDYFQQDALIVEAFEFAHNHLQHIMSFSRMRTLTTFFGFIAQGIRNIYQFDQQNPDLAFSSDQINNYITRYMIWALLWSVAGDCNSTNKNKLCDFIETRSEIPLPNCVSSSNNLTLFDFNVNINDCNWTAWSQEVPSFEMESKNVVTADIIVPTVDTVRNNNILVALLNSHVPVILCGPPGSGKTMTLLCAIRSIPNVDIVNLNFSCATTSELIMKTFEQYCEYRRNANGTVLSPSNPRRWLVVFCDEINLPDYDKYGTQKVVSFLRQLISKRGFYRKKDYSWVSLERILFVGACNPPTDLGRKPLPPRFLRHVPVFYVDYPGYESILQIYQTFTNATFSTLPKLQFYTESIVNAMVDVYFAAKERFTSDVQPHYIFSPREMTRWIRGLNEFIGNNSNEITIENIVRLWAHEALRLFHDRLILLDERNWMLTVIKDVAEKYFDQLNLDNVLMEPILFSSWLSGNYESINTSELRQYLLSRLKVYCEEETDVHLVLYDELIDFVLRLDRIYHQPQGHALLIGVSGSGKTTLSKFVAWLNGMSVYQVRIHRKYTIQHFDDDLRHVLRRAGCRNEKIVFIMDESNVLDSSFIERTNTLLANGEIPGLFDGDDYNLLMSQIKDCAQQDSKMIDSSPADLYRYFIENVIRNLHIVFTMSPSDNGLQDKSSASPALFNRCVVNWFGDWSYETLYNVGLEFLDKLNVDPNQNYVVPQNFTPISLMPVTNNTTNLLNEPITLKHVIVDLMVQFHMSIQDINIKLKSNSKLTYALSPRQFLDFVAHYITMFNEKREKLESERIHLDVGLTKIKETLENVESMNENLSAKRVELEAKNKLANEKLKLMFDEQKQAEDKKQETTLIQSNLEVQTQQINVKQSSVKEELSKVEPAINEAKQAVSSINKKNLVELKSMSNPPLLVKIALESVCVMLGNPTTDWKEIRSCIIKDDFIQKVVNFSTENITPAIRITMEKNYLSKPEYNYEKINRASNACGPLVKWAIAQIYYAQMIQKVQPLREELIQLEKALDESNTQLHNAKETIQDLEKRISQYKEEYAVLVSDVQNIKQELTTTESRVQRSVSLISSLASERSRWAISCENFSENLKTLPGDILLCSAFVVYGGYFDQGIRSTLWNSWKYLMNSMSISCITEISPSDYLSNVDEVMLWKCKGLPSDKLCIENVIILQQYKRFPLIIDPSGQAYEFLIKHLSSIGKKVSVTSFLDDSFQKSLEIAVRFGTTLFIMDVENFDPIINPLLNMDVRRSAGRTLISIGANELDLSPTFSLYLFSRDPWFEVPSDLASRVTLVNFTITPKSLQNQCLDIVLKSERPDVEAKREDLGKMQGEFQSILRNLEKKLLHALSDTQGSLLDNDSVIQTLECLKKEAADISLKVAETDKTIQEVELTTNLYLPLSVACSCIYFTLESLNSIHSLYHYNLKFFLSMYQSVLDQCKRNDNKLSHKQRFNLISKNLFILVNNRVTKGLLHEHRIVFSIQLCMVWVKTIKKNLIFEKIFQHYLYLESSTATCDRKQFPTSLQYIIKKDSEVEALLRIEHCGVFENFFESLTKEKKSLQQWISNSTLSEEQLLPNVFHLTNEESMIDQPIYKKLCQQLLVQALKPELLIASSHQLVESIFGADVHSSDVNLYDVVFNQVTSATPILLCSVVGYDASTWVDDLVSTHSAKEQLKLISIAMGSMEGYMLAENAINKASRDGQWVILKNVHLAASWLKNVEKKVHSLQLHPKFRLFMTCEIQPDIPKSIIRISRVLTFEPPPGIKANLIRTFSGLSPVRVFKDPIERCRLYFLLAWLHAVIMERLRYIPLGWSKIYEFNESDFRVACDVIDSWVDEASKRRTNLAPSKIPWDAIRSILSKCIYGGRLDNIFDKKILDGFISDVFKVESFEEDFYLVNKHSAQIKVPNCRSLNEYIEWINENIPPNECPEWLNLPPNAETVLSIYKGNLIRTNLLRLQLVELDSKVSLPSSQPKSKQSVTSMDQEIQPSKLMKIPSIVSPWLELLPLQISTLSKNASHLSNPIYRFYERELRQAKQQLDLVRSNLENIIEICNGLQKKTNDLEIVMDCIVQDKIPDKWKSYETPKNLSLNLWIHDLTERMERFSNIYSIISNSSIETIYNIPVWLGGFFAPEAFLTATRQYVAQQNHLSLEQLYLNVDFNSCEESNKDSDNSFYFIIKNSFIFGGKFIDGICNITDDIFCEIPVWKFTWAVDSLDIQTDRNALQIPVYLDETRTQLLLTVVASKNQKNPSNEYYNRGVAITLCNFSK